jgi:hypothetical protein
LLLVKSCCLLLPAGPAAGAAGAAAAAAFCLTHARPQVLAAGDTVVFGESTRVCKVVLKEPKDESRAAAASFLSDVLSDEEGGKGVSLMSDLSGGRAARPSRSNRDRRSEPGR